jgi:predicted O-methyltransferase YrrM
MRARDVVPVWRLERLWRKLKRRGMDQTPLINIDVPTEYDEILREIDQLPNDWHGAGVCGTSVLRAIAVLAKDRQILNSVETGVGKSTILLSHVSPNHTSFALDDTGLWNSLQQVRNSPLVNKSHVKFVVGPTQKTLPDYNFTGGYQLVLIDGPHGYPFPELEYFYFYPHLAEGGLLILDDIHIPTIFRLFSFLREERMFDFLGVVCQTAVFCRNSTPLFDPVGDGWWIQNYNKKRFPITRFDRDHQANAASMSAEFRKLMTECGHGPETQHNE